LKAENVMAKEKVSTTLRLPTALKRRADLVAMVSGKSLNSIIIDGLGRELDRLEGIHGKPVLTVRKVTRK